MHPAFAEVPYWTRHKVWEFYNSLERVYNEDHVERKLPKAMTMLGIYRVEFCCPLGALLLLLGGNDPYPNVGIARREIAKYSNGAIVISEEALTDFTRRYARQSQPDGILTDEAVYAAIGA